MHDLNQLFEECMHELDALHIPYGTISEIQVNTRAKKRLGLCKMLPDKTFRIEISDRLLGDNIPKQAVKHTIIHELLHAVPGCMNHKAKWKEQAEKVNRAYGYQIRRASSFEERGITDAEVQLPKPKYKYRLQCVSCPTNYSYYRWCSTLEHYKNCRCSDCGSRLKLIRLA